MACLCIASLLKVACFEGADNRLMMCCQISSAGPSESLPEHSSLGMNFFKMKNDRVTYDNH